MRSNIILLRFNIKKGIFHSISQRQNVSSGFDTAPLIKSGFPFDHALTHLIFDLAGHSAINLENLMKKLKIIGLIAGIVCLPIVSFASIVPQPIDNELDNTNHRFQIFIAEHNAIVNGKAMTMKSIFKIDLETGTVWRYRQGVDSKGKPYEEFFEVPNQ